MKFKSIQAKIASLAGLCLAGTVLFIVGYSVFSVNRTNQYVESKVSTIIESKTTEALQNLASTQAGRIQAEFDTALVAARTMAQTFAVMVDPKNPGMSLPERRRNAMDAILLNVLKNNPRFNGTYSAWDPNAIDGRDSEFAGTNGYDKTGRFIPYWTRGEGGKIARQPLVEYDSRERHLNGVMKGGWYIGPMENHKESVLDPLPYLVQGKAVFLATLSVPILSDGKFLGVAGSDFNLDFVQKLAVDVSKSVFDGHSEVIIISNMGLIVANSANANLIGQPLARDDSEAAADLKRVQAGEDGVDSQNGKIRAFAPIPLGETGKPWSVMVRVPQALVLADAVSLNESLSDKARSDVMGQVAVGVVVVLIAVGAVWVVAGRIASPIRACARFAEGIAEGDFNQTLDARSGDELGTLADALRKMLDDLKRMITQRAADQEKAEGERRTATRALADDLEAQVRGVVESVDGAARTMNSTAQDMSSSASHTSSQATVVAAATEEANANVQTVAAATEELSASITEIGSRVRGSADIAREAVEAARKANEQVLGLTEAAERIGAVVQLIQNIAAQTNLLALNATIEAARAGEAGKGFAVVAGEVKSLANQTAKATEDIASQVEEMRGVTNETASVIRSVGTIISRIDEIAAGIASSVEQQNAATHEIARNIQQAAVGTRQVSANIGGVRETAEAAGNSANQVLRVSQELADESGNLRRVIDGFLAKIRA